MKSHIFTLFTKSLGWLKILNLLLTGWIKKTLNRMQSLSLLLILVHFTLSSTQRPDKDTMLFD